MSWLWDALDEATLEKHGDGAGARSASRVALIVGLGIFGFIMLEAQVVVLGVLAGWWQWPDVSGYFTWVAAFSGSTVVPYAAKHILRMGGDS